MEHNSPSGDNFAGQSNLFPNLAENMTGSSGSHYSHRRLRSGSIIIFLSVISWMVLFSTVLGLSRPVNVSSGSASVTTYHNDNSRSGVNAAETILTPLNVNAGQFGKLFSYSVDGDVYAQPLYLPDVSVVGKGVRNVVYVATENDSVYAFDADSKAGANSSPLWHTSFVNPSAGITSVSSLDVSCSNISPKIGITGTPVIDRASGTLYVVAKTKENGAFVQRLHALDVTSGVEKFGGPVVIRARVRGTGQGAKEGILSFDSLGTNQRSGLLFQNGLVYVAWASQCDSVRNHGWVIAFDATTLATKGVWNPTPHGEGGGIWQSGEAPAADSAGNVYFATGSGDFTANAGGLDFGDSILKLSPSSNGTIAVGDYFTPYNEASLNAAHNDLGSGGVLLLPAQPSGSPHQHLLIQSGREGTIYLIDRDSMGRFDGTNSSQIVQSLPGVLGPVLSTPGWWNNTIYFAGARDVVKAYAFNPSTGLLSTVPSSESITPLDFPGATPSISSNDLANGIVWAVQTDASQTGGLAVLHAYDATNLSNELYNSSQNQNRDNPGPAVISVVPTVVNGKVYVGARSQLTVYGLLGSQVPGTGAAPTGAVKSLVQVAASSSGGIGFVQVNATNLAHGTYSTVSLAYANAQTAGNLNIVAVGWNDTTALVQSVKDSLGNPYTLAVGPTSGSALRQSLYYATNIAAGSNTVTVTFSPGAADPDIRILEYRGVGTFDVAVGASGSSGSNTTVSSGSKTTTSANELIFGAGMTDGGFSGAGSGFTKEIITHQGDIAEDLVASSAGSESATAVLGAYGTQTWVMQMAAFKAAIITTNPPTISSVSPSSGSDNGGTSVTITGTNFTSGAAATFTGTDASNVTVVSSTTITATTRAHIAGAVTVLVTNPNGQSGSLTNGYTYTANPTIMSLSPSSASVGGGTSVTITGTNFASGATVTFGGTAATKVTFISSTSITATVPTHAAGGVSVVVTNPNGLSGAHPNGFIYNATASTIKFVQVAAATPQTPMSSVSVTYPSAQTGGNLNVVVVGWNDTTSSVQSVKDSHGNAYTLAVGPTRGINLSQSIYYFKNIPSGTNTVTATFNQAAAAVDMRALEYSGTDTLNPLDATASATGNSSTAGSGSALTNAGNELVVAADMVYTGNSGPGPGFTKRIITLPDSDLVEDEIVSTAGAYGATAPLTSSGPWVMQMVTLHAFFVQLPATGPLQVSLSNPRYFADGSGKPTYLTGVHTWPNNKDGWGVAGNCPPPQFDWTGYLNYVQSRHYNWIRLWTWELPTSTSEPHSPSTECHLPLPFLRAGPGYATDGQLKFDLTQFDQSFFDRLRQRVIDAGQRGIYVTIMLFDGFGLNHVRVANDGYWFTGSNNINGVDDGYTGVGGSGTGSQSGSNAAITNIQNAYVQKVIDTVNDLDNVMYEIANEPGQSYSTTWETNLIAFIHNYEASKKKHPVGFTCQFPNNGNPDPTYFQSSADYVEPCYSGYGWPVAEISTGNKVVIDDTDHSWGWAAIQSATTNDPAAMRKWVWENFTDGANTAFMDPYLVVWPVRNCPASGGGESGTPCGAVVNGYATTTDPYWDTIRTALSQTATYAGQVDLAHMTPQNALCPNTSGATSYCLVSPGQQYLIYLPTGGTFTVTQLIPGTTYNYQWFNPAANAVAATGTITTVGSSYGFTAPFLRGDAVLLLDIH